MAMSKWLVATVALSAAAGVRAQAPAPTSAPAAEKTMAYITPYAGYTHIKIDSGRIYQEPDVPRWMPSSSARPLVFAGRSGC